jgi:hypothetical protein
MEESDGVCSTQTAVGSDTAEGTQNNTVLVQMEEEERVIRAMPFVTTLSFVRAVKGKAEGWRFFLQLAKKLVSLNQKNKTVRKFFKNDKKK